MFARRMFFSGILLATILVTGAGAATLRGTVYEWSDFEKPLKNTIVEVNSTPAQSLVATTGTYSFNLPPGSYIVKAKYYRNNILEYAAEEEIQIDREGDFVHDLLLFPPTESEDEYLGDINLTTSMDTSEYNIDYYIILILVFSVLIILYWSKRKKSILSEPAKNEPRKLLPENAAETKQKELPEDLHNLYDTILKMGGRTTQKELRKKIAFSEAKVSLMLDDLEDRGLIKKIKKGRANIIIAEAKS